MDANQSMDVEFGGDARYVATIRLPAQVLQQLEQVETGDSAFQITFGEGNEGNTLTIGGQSYNFSRTEEKNVDLMAEDDGRLSGIGAVQEKLVVKPNLSSAGASLQAAYEKAEQDKAKRKVDQVEVGSKKTKSKIVTTTITRAVTPPAQRPQPRRVHPLAAPQHALC